MCKKLTYLISFVVVLGLALTSTANAEPVGWWKFDDGSGFIAADSSGNGNNGTIYGNPQWIIGKYGAALEFDGDGDYVDLPIGSLLSTLTNSTFTIWADFANTGGSWQRLWDFGSGTQINMFLTPRMGGAGAMRFAITIGGNAAGAEDQTTAEATLASGWHHVAVVIDIDNTSHRLYLDAELVAEITDARYSPSSLGSPYQNWLGKSQYTADGYYVGSLDDFRIYDEALSVEELKTTMIGTEVYIAFGPYPSVGAIDVPLDVVFNWTPGKRAVTHDLYFGTDANDVNEANIDDPRGVLMSQNLAESTFSLPENLDYNNIYYWRVDEVNEAEPNSPWKGKLWSFTTVNYIVVEDFEDYNDFPPDEIWNTWIDGYGDPANGATAGYPAPAFFAGEHYMEDEIVHGGSWSMPVFYDNSEAGLSEVTRTFNDDWTRDDVLTLTLWYYGDASNVAEPMYIALNGNAVVTNNDPKAALDNEWNQWDMLLQDFADQGVNLANVNTMSIGFGNKANPQAGGGEGHVFFDDIRLYRSLPKEVEPEPEPVDPGTANLMAYYAFENDSQDSSGNGLHGTAWGNPQYVEGLTGYGMAISLDGTGDYVALPIGSAIAQMTDITVACWANFPNLGGSWQRLWDFGTGEEVYMFLSPCTGTDGPMRFVITIAGGAMETGIGSAATLPSGWRHVAATIDSASMTMKLYQDGKLVAEGETSVLPSDLGQTTQNWIGRSQYVADDYYLGSLDEFRIYDRALSHAEVRYLAGK